MDQPGLGSSPTHGNVPEGSRTQAQREEKLQVGFVRDGCNKMKPQSSQILAGAWEESWRGFCSVLPHLGLMNPPQSS